VFGAKLSSDGVLLFQPLTDGIDIFDGKLGTLRSRIALPMALSENYDALVSDGKDNVLLAITGQKGDGGVAIVDLTSLPEPFSGPAAEPVLPFQLKTFTGVTRQNQKAGKQPERRFQHVDGSAMRVKALLGR